MMTKRTIWTSRKTESKKRYFNTRNAAWQFLIENHVLSYPLDLKRIVKENGWKVKDLNKYVMIHPEIKRFVRKREGLTIRVGETYVILVDFSKPPQRTRFTVAHEIGHIYLETQFEKEANMFAARILMPMIVLKELQLATPIQISQTFDVSLQAATFRLNRFYMIKTRIAFDTNRIEQQVHKQLSNFLQRSKI